MNIHIKFAATKQRHEMIQSSKSWLSTPIPLSQSIPNLFKEERAYRCRLVNAPIDPDDYEDLKDDYETQESKS